MEPRKRGGRPAAEPDPESLGHRVRIARLSARTPQHPNGWPQAAFADAVASRLPAGFAQPRLSRIEQNTSEPTLAELVAMADVAGVSVAWLAWGFIVTGDDAAARARWLARARGDSAGNDERADEHV